MIDFDVNIFTSKTSDFLGVNEYDEEVTSLDKKLGDKTFKIKKIKSC